MKKIILCVMVKSGNVNKGCDDDILECNVDYSRC